jgi:hypothetical protein
MIRHLHIFVALILSCSFVQAEQVYTYDNSIAVLYGNLVKENAPTYDATNARENTYLALQLPSPIKMQADPNSSTFTVDKIQLSFPHIYSAGKSTQHPAGQPIRVSCRLYPGNPELDFTPVVCDVKVFRLNVKPIGIDTPPQSSE